MIRCLRKMTGRHKMSLDKTIRSRSNKNIGDVIEENWEITARTVIAEPQSGDPRRGVPPRLGIYEYEVKPIVQQVSTKPTGGKRRQNEASVGGDPREALSRPFTVRKITQREALVAPGPP